MDKNAELNRLACMLVKVKADYNEAKAIKMNLERELGRKWAIYQKALKDFNVKSDEEKELLREKLRLVKESDEMFKKMIRAKNQAKQARDRESKMAFYDVAHKYAVEMHALNDRVQEKKQKLIALREGKIKRCTEAREEHETVRQSYLLAKANLIATEACKKQIERKYEALK